MNVYDHETKPIKIWATDLEDGAMQQARNLANLPFTYKHVALMPDAHFGYGMPIGGVLATDGVVIPNAVGVDIGCGMIALETSINFDDTEPEQLKQVLGHIRQTIPVGFKKRKDEKHVKRMPRYTEPMPIVEEHYGNGVKSLGTLGGGNHFIELQTDGEKLWAMIHSGSRNLGKQVADHYNREAKRLNKCWHSNVPPEWDLAFLPLETPTAASYLEEMDYCLAFADANRRAMMADVIECLSEVFGRFFYGPMTSIHHNYAAQEHHFGRNVMIHRKGATLAREGTVGIIPGSQGTSSYIVKGQGNPESFNSCSHGAGRRMGRKQAQRELNLADEQASMVGIIHSVRNAKDLDEAPSAYKDIHQVMAAQDDLVEVITSLIPLASVKG